MRHKRFMAMCVAVLLAMSLQAVAAGPFVAGQRVVLLQNDPPGGTGLAAGHGGTVICCDSNDCSGGVLVSWDFWNSSKPPAIGCANDPGTLTPANSVTWVDPNQVLLGIPFNKCGTISKTPAGCVYLASDEGKTYNVQVTTDEYLALDSAGHGIHFGDHVRVLGLLNTTPVPAKVIRLCPQQDGDVYSPILQPCPTTGCCTQSYKPGDRVVLAVSNPVGSGGSVATGLASGTLGTVICCGGTDPGFPVFVSWDGYAGGINSPCNPSQISYPNQSGWWMACSQITPYKPSLPPPILMNVGGNPLMLLVDPNAPGPGYTFAGCVTIPVELSFQAKLTVQVTPASGVGGTWTGTVTPNIVGPGTVNVQICVQVVNLDISTLPVGNSVQVATVSLFAAPYP